MKRNKLLYGFLAAALLMNSIVWPASTAEAAAPDLDKGLTAYYTFDDSTLDNSVEGGETAAPLGSAMGNYSGETVFEKDGKKGGAVRLGSYGLDLKQKDLGDNFTISLWMKPDGTFAENQNLLFLGYNNPEKWFSVAGNATNGGKSSQCKVWANGGTKASYQWKTFDTCAIDSAWHLLTLTGTSEKMSAYLDGQQVASGNTNQPLTGADQGAYVGVTFWKNDAPFAGLVDEIRVYNRALSDAEIQMLYDGKSAEDLLEDTVVTGSMKLPLKRSRTIEVIMPAAVQEAGVMVSYASSDPDVASVDADGRVTARKEGTADITVRLSLNGKTVEKKTAVTVQGTLEESLVAYYNFDENIQNQQGTDSADALITNASSKTMDSYTGSVAYADGREGKAVLLGDYGFRLNQKKIGEEYTVSLWMKPTESLRLNQCLLLLGRQTESQEQWLALSGASAGEGKIWANGGCYGTHTTLFSPEIKKGQWYQLTFSGTKGEVTVYLDGICLGTAKSNDPLNAADGDIYLGVNRWDDEFVGLMDEVKVYNIALDEEEVQNQAKEEFNRTLENRMNKEVTLRPGKILAENRNAQEVKYNLVLPAEMAGLPIVWTSSNESVLKADGTVVTPAENTEVTLTATITSGLVSASREYDLTVLALDRSALERLLEKAASVDRANLVDASLSRLDAAVAEAEKADSFAAIDHAADLLSQALGRLCYQEDYEAPFGSIVSPAVRASVKVGTGEELFVLAENIRDAVDVEYLSEKPDVASYEEGTVIGLASGKTVVTAVVTSRYDQWEMRYSTAVTVEQDETEEQPGTPGGDTQEPSETPDDDNQEPSEIPGGDTQEPSETPDGDSQNPSETPDGSGSNGGGSRKHKSDRPAAEAVIPDAGVQPVMVPGAPVYGRGSVDAAAQIQEEEAAQMPAVTSDAGIEKNEAPSEPDEPVEFRDVEDENVPQSGLEKNPFAVFPYILALAVLTGLLIFFLILKKRKTENESEEI